MRNNRGQGLIEYLILVAIMGVASIAIIRLLNHTVNAQFATIVNYLQGKPKRVEKEAVSEDYYKKKDFTDFMNGAATQE